MNKYFIAATVIFVIGSTLDYFSSLGGREGWPLHRRADGRFSPPRYVLWSAAAYALFPVLAHIYDIWGWAAGILTALGGARIGAAIYNYRLRAKSRRSGRR